MFKIQDKINTLLLKSSWVQNKEEDYQQLHWREKTNLVSVDALKNNQI